MREAKRVSLQRDRNLDRRRCLLNELVVVLWVVHCLSVCCLPETLKPTTVVVVVVVVPE